jgi:hypothetical protein
MVVYTWRYVEFWVVEKKEWWKMSLETRTQKDSFRTVLSRSKRFGRQKKFRISKRVLSEFYLKSF